jgi:hypothetical protein
MFLFFACSLTLAQCPKFATWLSSFILTPLFFNFILLFPFPAPNRYSYELGGGAMMDTGEVALDAVRHVMGDVSLVCTEAKCKTAYPNIDQDMTCEFLATNSATAVVDCSIWSLGPRISLVVKVPGEHLPKHEIFFHCHNAIPFFFFFVCIVVAYRKT